MANVFFHQMVLFRFHAIFRQNGPDYSFLGYNTTSERVEIKAEPAENITLLSLSLLFRLIGAIA